MVDFSSPLGSNITLMSGSQLFIRCSALLFVVPAVYAGPGQLSMSSQIQYPTVIQGYQDPVSAQIYNEAAPGSDPVNFSVYATFPYGNSSTYSGTRAADGGSGYLTLPFSFNSGLVNPGSQTVSVTATDTGTSQSLTQSGSVLVLAHADPAFNIGGNVVQLSSEPLSPAAQEPSVDPLAFGATGGGESFAAGAPGVINDPVAPTAGLDLDSITAIGDSQITLSLTPFTDLAANDNPAFGDPFQILVDGSVPGVYFTDFELNYSDEQDLPGADATGSEHAYFAVQVTVTSGGVTGMVVVPEPGSGGLLALGLLSVFLVARPRRRLIA
jgi:hypothetical protein